MLSFRISNARVLALCHLILTLIISSISVLIKGRNEKHRKLKLQTFICSCSKQTNETQHLPRQQQAALLNEGADKIQLLADMQQECTCTTEDAALIYWL